jgi:S-adenosyl-L-methionine hydrolase (adenosine-forming)
MPRTLVTLTTDFGTVEPYAAMMKAVILMRAPGTQVIDLTHDIPAWQPEIAGFWLQHCLPWFASGTVHLAVVDPGVGTGRRLLAAELGDQVIIAPDNGLLGPVVARYPRTRVREVALEPLAGLLPAARSHTFHGRDVLAPLAGEMAAGRLSIIGLGEATDEYQRGTLGLPEVREGVIHGQVVLADRWGNLLTNIEAPRPAAEGSLRLRIAGQELPLARTYAELPEGRAGAVINAHGLVEVAVNRGSAAELLGAGSGTPADILGAEIPAPRPTRPGGPGGRPAGAGRG